MHKTGVSSSFAILLDNPTMHTTSLLLAVVFAATPAFAQDDMLSQRPDPQSTIISVSHFASVSHILWNREPSG